MGLVRRLNYAHLSVSLISYRLGCPRSLRRSTALSFCLWSSSPSLTNTPRCRCHTNMQRRILQAYTAGKTVKSRSVNIGCGFWPLALTCFVSSTPCKMEVLPSAYSCLFGFDFSLLYLQFYLYFTALFTLSFMIYGTSLLAIRCSRQMLVRHVQNYYY